MTWLERKAHWIPQRADEAPRPAQPIEKSYKVSEVAKLLSVAPGTVWKWLAADEETGEAVIPANGWYKLPGSGHVRIREWAVKMLQEGR